MFAFAFIHFSNIFDPVTHVILPWQLAACFSLESRSSVLVADRIPKWPNAILSITTANIKLWTFSGVGSGPHIVRLVQQCPAKFNFLWLCLYVVIHRKVARVIYNLPFDMHSVHVYCHSDCNSVCYLYKLRLIKLFKGYLAKKHLLHLTWRTKLAWLV